MEWISFFPLFFIKICIHRYLYQSTSILWQFLFTEFIIPFPYLKGTNFDKKTLYCHTFWHTFLEKEGNEIYAISLNGEVSACLMNYVWSLPRECQYQLSRCSNEYFNTILPLQPNVFQKSHMICTYPNWDQFLRDILTTAIQRTVVCKIIESPSSFDFYRFFFLTKVIFSFQFYRQSIDSDVLSQYLLINTERAHLNL